MRLAAISDIHGNLIALETVLADLKASGGADKLWLLGDYAAFGPRPAECIQRLQALVAEWGEDKLAFVRGNTDRYLVTGGRPPGKPAEDAEQFARLAPSRREWAANLEWGLEQLTFAEYEWLTKLRGETDLEAPGWGHVIGYHGTPGDDEGMLTPETPDEEAEDALLDREGRLGIGGHIHRQMDRRLGGWRAVNIGSAGMSFDRPGYAQYGIFTFAEGDVQVDLRALPYDVEPVIDDLRVRGYPGWERLAQRLRTGT